MTTKNMFTRFIFFILYFSLFSFLIFGMWEWMQSPFYQDISTDFNRIVWFRIHCSLIDVLIVLGSAAFVTVIRRKLDWFVSLKIGDFALLSAGGALYTAVSEYVNVEELQRWGYSPLMPRVPLLGIGVIPILQWLLLPALVLLLTKNHLSGIKRD